MYNIHRHKHTHIFTFTTSHHQQHPHRPLLARHRKAPFSSVCFNPVIVRFTRSFHPPIILSLRRLDARQKLYLVYISVSLVSCVYQQVRIVVDREKLDGLILISCAMCEEPEEHRNIIGCEEPSPKTPFSFRVESNRVSLFICVPGYCWRPSGLHFLRLVLCLFDWLVALWFETSAKCIDYIVHDQCFCKSSMGCKLFVSSDCGL